MLIPVPIAAYLLGAEADFLGVIDLVINMKANTYLRRMRRIKGETYEVS